MGYLTLVVAEIENRAGVRDLPEEAIAAALDKEDGFFGYESDGSVYARKVAATDLERQARRAGLVPVDALLAVSPRAVQIARQATKHGGYLDALDMKRLERNADMLLEKENDRIARQIFANYQAHRVRDGKPVEYRTFDEQPEDLKESCRDQARQMRDKLESLDFDIVAWDECPEELRVKALSARQVEHLADREHERWVEERTRAGWTYAPGDKGRGRKDLALPRAVGRARRGHQGIRPRPRARNDRRLARRRLCRKPPRLTAFASHQIPFPLRNGAFSPSL